MVSITPFLWFDGQVRQAVDFYASVFPDAEIISTSVFPGDAPDRQAGDFMTATIRIAGQEVTILDGGPSFTLDPAFSFFVSCKGQDEVDYYWDKLLEGGKASQCGWLTDKFGLSWQIVPTRLGELLSAPDREAADRALQAMLTMVKLDIAGLESAFNAA